MAGRLRLRPAYRRDKLDVAGGCILCLVVVVVIIMGVGMGMGVVRHSHGNGPTQDNTGHWTWGWDLIDQVTIIPIQTTKL
jgi:hypothetical protein